MFASVQTLSLADIYGGKLCAAFDRQHPRDFFDIKLLLDNEGITESIRKAFIIYLASHSRPMNELLNPNWKDISKVYASEFEGMTTISIKLSDLKDAAQRAHKIILDQLTSNERNFLISLKQGEPRWELLELSCHIESLPGIQWKLQNIKKMPREKNQIELKKLSKVLGL